MKQNMKRKIVYILILLAGFFIPMYTEIPYNRQYDTSTVITEVLSNPVIYRAVFLFPVAKLILLMLFIGSIFLKNKFTRVYSLMAVLLLLPVIIFQNMSYETSFGFAALLQNYFVMLVIVALFIWEIKAKRNDFTEYKITKMNIITFILAFIAFWMPARNGMLYFSIKDLFLNEAGLTFCMIMPIIISSLLMYRETINLTLLRIMSFIGVYYGLLNLMTWFILNPVYWWMGILHFPLLINSVIGFIVAIKEERNRII
jgi:hypothetical protein